MIECNKPKQPISIRQPAVNATDGPNITIPIPRVWNVIYNTHVSFMRIFRYCEINSNLLNSRDAGASLGYSDRRLCSDGCPSTSVVCDAQQQQQWLLGPPLDIFVHRPPFLVVLSSAAYHVGIHGRIMIVGDAWLLSNRNARQTDRQSKKTYIIYRKQ